MSTSTNATAALKSVSAALSSISIQGHPNLHINSTAKSVSSLLNATYGEDVVAVMHQNERAAALFNTLQDANVKSVKAAYPESWQNILTAEPVELTPEDFIQVEIPDTTEEGLTYLIPALSALHHGVDNVEGAESVFAFYQQVPLDLSMARMDLRFGGNDHDNAIEDVAESIIRLRNSGDKFYALESGLRHILASLELQGATKDYWPDEVFMHILKAADESKPLVIPTRWDDPSAQSITMPMPSSVSKSSYRVSGDIPSSTEKDIANVHYALVKMDRFLKSPDTQILGVDSKPLEEEYVKRLSENVTQVMHRHAQMGQDAGFDLDPYLSYTMSKQKKAEYLIPNKTVSVIGPSSAMIAISNSPQVRDFSPDQSFVIAASRSPDLYVFKDPVESDFFLRNSKDPCFIGVAMSQKEINDIQFHISTMPAKMALMIEALRGNKYLDGKIVDQPGLTKEQVVQHLATEISNIIPGIESEVFARMPKLLSSHEWSGVKDGYDLVRALFTEVPVEFSRQLQAEPLVPVEPNKPKDEVDVEKPSLDRKNSMAR